MDVTTPNTAALNAANESAREGMEVRHQRFNEQQQLEQTELQKQHLGLLQQDQQLRERIDARNAKFVQDQLDRASSEREGTSTAIQQYLKDPAFQPGADDPMHPRTRTGTGSWNADAPQDEIDQLRKFHQERRSAVADFASGLSPSARAAFLKTRAPLLSAEEDTELEHSDARQLHKQMTYAAGKGLFSPEMDETVIQPAISGLETGQEKPADARRAFFAAAESSKRDLITHSNDAYADTLFQKFAAENATNPGAMERLHEAYADWMDPKNAQKDGTRSPRQLNHMLFAAAHGASRVRVGNAQIAQDAPPSQWLPAAEHASDEAVSQALEKDPFWSAQMKNAKDDNAIERLKTIRHPGNGKTYAEDSQDRRDASMRMFGGQFGMSPETMKALGYGDKKADRDKLNAIKAALKKAGIDPDMNPFAPQKDKKGSQPTDESYGFKKDEAQSSASKPRRANSAEVLPGERQQPEYSDPEDDTGGGDEDG